MWVAGVVVVITVVGLNWLRLKDAQSMYRKRKG
jgi:hypothetical protein